MSCTKSSTAHVAGTSCCQPCSSRRWEKYPWRCRSVTATMGMWRSAAARTVSPARTPSPPRSEEHTSELQSRQYLVCRLLLEKKKKQYFLFLFKKKKKKKKK